MEDNHFPYPSLLSLTSLPLPSPSPSLSLSLSLLSHLLPLSLSLSLPPRSPFPLSLPLPPSLPLHLLSLRSLRPIDVEFMKHLHGFVNIVPVIAKADTLTIEERDSFKQRISEDLHFHGISIYPSAYGAEDEEDASANAKIEVSVRDTGLGRQPSRVLPPFPVPLSMLLSSSLPSSPSPPSLPPSLPPSVPTPSFPPSLPPAIHSVRGDRQ